jgi:hypothetical protein
MTPKDKIEEFLRIAMVLNQELDCVPVLYGSLGLWHIAKHEFIIDDIDILVPDKFMKGDWNKLQELIEKQDYKLMDAREHEFEKEGQKMAFAGFTALVDDLAISIDTLATVNESGAKYLELALKDYLAAYEFSQKDGYRKNVRQKRDLDKIDFIKSFLL